MGLFRRLHPLRSDPLNHARFQVFSTNYKRTQISAQGFLEGFLGDRGSVPVVVRPRSQDFLNQWESQGEEMKEVGKGRVGCSVSFRRGMCPGSSVSDLPCNAPMFACSMYVDYA